MGRGNKRYFEELKVRLSQFTVDRSCFVGISDRKLAWLTVHLAKCALTDFTFRLSQTVPSLPASFLYDGIYQYLPSAFLKRSDEGADIKNTLQTKRLHI